MGWVAAVLYILSASHTVHAAVTYLDNGTIRLGVDLAMGGSITYLSPSAAQHSTKTNVVNSADLGRQIQQSYYASPNDFDPKHNQASFYDPWPWNANQSGDAFLNRSQVLAKSNNGTEIYVKSRPMQWALNKVPSQATMEEWITLDGASAHVRCRLTTQRTDNPGVFAPIHQELPAVYTVGTLYRLVTYQGLQPFTNGALTEMTQIAGPPWQYWRATENWAALIDKTGWGLGVRNYDAVQFGGGFCGTPGQGGTKSTSTGHLSPLIPEILNPKGTYQFSYDLILGTVDEIRNWVYEHPTDTRLDYRFANDRQHWISRSGESNDPTDGHLHVNLAGSDPGISGPLSTSRAEDVPTLYISAAYHLGSSTAVGQLFWEVDNAGGFSEEQSLRFNVIPDGQFHTYALDLSSCSSYHGLISQLRFDPILSGSAGDYMDLDFISYLNLNGPMLPIMPDLAAAAASAAVGSASSAAAVPEPSTLVLLLVALVSLVAYGRRRRGIHRP